MNTEPEALRVALAVEAECYPHAFAAEAARLLREQHAEIERLRAERLILPPECETEAERKAYAFGFWAGVAAAKKEGAR